MQVTSEQLVRMVYNRMSNTIRMSRGSYNRQDPTHYEKGICWVWLPMNPFARNEEEAEERQYKLSYMDCTWGIQIEVYSEDGPILFQDYLDPEDGWRWDKGKCEDLLLKFLIEGDWRSKKIDWEAEDMAREADRMIRANI